MISYLKMNLFQLEQLVDLVVEKVGTVGVGTTSTVTLKYNKDNP